MTERTRKDDQDEPIELVVRGTTGEGHDDRSRREAVEQELEDRGRSDEGAHVEASELASSPAAGVLDDDLQDPPEPSEPG